MADKSDIIDDSMCCNYICRVLYVTLMLRKFILKHLEKRTRKSITDNHVALFLFQESNCESKCYEIFGIDPKQADPSFSFYVK